jgi:hypothetical protein
LGARMGPAMQVSRLMYVTALVAEIPYTCVTYRIYEANLILS